MHALRSDGSDKNSWHWQLQPAPDGALIAWLADAAGRRPAADEVLRRWSEDPSFAQFWSARLAEVPFAAYCWEMPPLWPGALDAPFECAFVESPLLARPQADPRDFQAHFAAAAAESQVVSFDNLGGDAHLVVPLPRGALSAYPHLAAFVRAAPPAQQRALWQCVARQVQARLGPAPLWLSTAGLGVPWLHVRLDRRPKYYRHRPYAAADLRTSGT